MTDRLSHATVLILKYLYQAKIQEKFGDDDDEGARRIESTDSEI